MKATTTTEIITCKPKRSSLPAAVALRRSAETGCKNAGTDGPGAQTARTRGHRGRADGEHERDARNPADDARPRHTHRARRFRYRLFFVGLPDAHADRTFQDR